MQKYQKWIFYISLVGVLFLGFNWRENFRLVKAQEISGGDVFWAMNDVRAIYGLEPYVMRDDLMQLAQTHAEYMASIETLTHTRADGSQPNVTAENVSLGPIQIAINTWMDDQPHKDTILAWSTGWAGAGVAVGENGYVYISFDMIKMPGATYAQVFDPYPPVPTTDPNAPTLAPGVPTPTWAGIFQGITAVEAATPDAKGFIWHEVKYGQTLWAIATGYGVSTDRIVGLNSLDAKDPTIYEGQKLLIDMVTPPTPAPTATITPIVTETMTATPTVKPTQTKTPTVLKPTLAVIPPDIDGDSQTSGGWWIIVPILVILGGGAWYLNRKGLLPDFQTIIGKLIKK